MPSGLAWTVTDGAANADPGQRRAPVRAPRREAWRRSSRRPLVRREPDELLGETEIRPCSGSVTLERRLGAPAPQAGALRHRRRLMRPGPRRRHGGPLGRRRSAPAASHVVAQVLRQVGINVAPAAPLHTAGTGTRSSGHPPPPLPPLPRPQPTSRGRHGSPNPVRPRLCPPSLIHTQMLPQVVSPASHVIAPVRTTTAGPLRGRVIRPSRPPPPAGVLRHGQGTGHPQRTAPRSSGPMLQSATDAAGESGRRHRDRKQQGHEPRRKVGEGRGSPRT